MSLREKYNDRVRKIRQAAAAAIRELSIFRSGGPVTTEALEAEVARIGKEKLQPHGCDLVVRRMDCGVIRFLIKVQSTGKRYDLIKSFFHRDDEVRHNRAQESYSEREAGTYS